MADLISELVETVTRVAPPEGAQWLTQQLSFDAAGFQAAFAGAGRRLGRAPIGDAGAARLSVPWSGASGADECGRAALVLVATRALPPAEHIALVRDLIRRGDLRERQAVLRVLAGLPDPARFVDLAIDACRTNAQSVFEAIACDNAYPVAYFPDPALHQMVVKSLLMGAPVARIVNLSSRITDELIRMAEALGNERRAAGRPVPDDLRLISRSAS